MLYVEVRNRNTLSTGNFGIKFTDICILADIIVSLQHGGVVVFAHFNDVASSI